MGKHTRQNEPGGSGKITDYVDEPQPQWARRMEEILSEKMEAVTQAVTHLDDHAKETGAKFEQIDQRLLKIDERIDGMEFHDRKYNLLFFGLKVNRDDCETGVRAFLRDDLELGDEEKHMSFQHCHPLPPSNKGVPACIVRFVSFKHRERVLQSLGKLKGKNKRVSVRTDLPRVLREKRAKLQQQIGIMKQQNRDRILRVAEKGQDVILQEKIRGTWSKVND
jgi:hypothetical protein